MFSTTIKIITALAIGVFVVLGLAVALQPQLDTIHKQIVSDFDNVQHIESEFLDAMPQTDTLIFDVREAPEYAVSHIAGAIQVDPNIDPLDFEEQYGDLLAGKTAVFYCSVGRRSSELASKLDEVLEDNGVSAAYNLVGGIFQWSNETRPLINEVDQATSKVHPFNKYWGRLIQNEKVISYQK